MVAVPRSARELQELALAFNEMVERLEGKRQALVRETTERIELEKRLLRSEVFAAIGRLSGGLAHELGSPLGVITVRAEAIERNEAATPALREHAAEITAEVDRMARLVRDLLHVAHRHGVVLAPLDLRDVARAVYDSVRSDTLAAALTVELHLPPDPVIVAGDALLLRHALNNVAVNALQALRGSDTGGRVVLTVEGLGDRACVTVEDDGPGIDPSHLSSATQPFFTTKDVGEGSGLGLAITAGIVEEHRGDLVLSPRPAGGLRVQIDLPLHRPSPDEVP
jgi:signal transduction histidine kinase